MMSDIYFCVTLVKYNTTATTHLTIKAVTDPVSKLLFNIMTDKELLNEPTPQQKVKLEKTNTYFHEVANNEMHNILNNDINTAVVFKLVSGAKLVSLCFSEEGMANDRPDTVGSSGISYISAAEWNESDQSYYATYDDLANCFKAGYNKASNMFRGYAHLTSTYSQPAPKIIKWTGVTDANSMFRNANINSINGLNTFFVDNGATLVDCSYMFYDTKLYNSTLQTVNVTIPGTFSEVTDTRSMFALSQATTQWHPIQGIIHVNINFSEAKFSKVVNMSNMFHNNANVRRVEFSSNNNELFKISDARTLPSINMTAMFLGARYIKSIVLINDNAIVTLISTSGGRYITPVIDVNTFSKEIDRLYVPYDDWIDIKNIEKIPVRWQMMNGPSEIVFNTVLLDIKSFYYICANSLYNIAINDDLKVSSVVPILYNNTRYRIAVASPFQGEVFKITLTYKNATAAKDYYYHSSYDTGTITNTQSSGNFEVIQDIDTYGDNVLSLVGSAVSKTSRGTFVIPSQIVNTYHAIGRGVYVDISVITPTSIGVSVYHSDLAIGTKVVVSLWLNNGTPFLVFATVGGTQTVNISATSLPLFADAIYSRRYAIVARA